MAMVIKNNMAAQLTLGELARNDKTLKKSLKKVSSGMRINGADDDASGYAISERMRTQIRGLEQDIKNTQNARSLMNTAEGAVQSTIDILRTFKEKALDAANDTNTDIDRATIQKELDQFIEQIDDNAHVTFNGKYLLNGTMGGNMPADERGVIVDFMSYLDNAALSAQEALDGAINYASGGYFQNEADLKERFLADMAGGDLLDACGIDLTNEDTGSITGSDAGGETTKTAESIVPENGLPYSGVVPGGTSTINGLTVNWPTASNYSAGNPANDTTTQNAMEAIAKALNNQWLKNCMELVDESYEMNFQEPGTTVHTMDVTFENDAGSNRLAAVGHTAVNGKADSLTLIVNMHYYSTLDLNDENGDSAAPGAGYLDRTLAHEMTHAIMAANITNFSGLPLYIKEGTAELVHGIDDYRGGTISSLAADNGRLGTALEATQSTQNGDDAYAAGYMILRYLAHQGANAEPEKRMVFQVGTKANQAIKVGFSDMRAEALGLKKADGTTLSVTTRKKATSALTVIDRAIQKALNQQTFIGAVQSRLDFTAANLTTASENTTASDSTIRDSDMAKEMTGYTKANVLAQAAQSMLAQANQNSSAILSLLQ